ncbi:hypothetical protein ACFWVF_00500 [Streptomyces sp. NPDC058659]|uniref:hypothetical protein n=1 Tax=unclassified Streptomyces TaxID=2593676 RepID=UPI003657CC2B
MTSTLTFKVGDIVRDSMRHRTGKVWRVSANLVELQDLAGYTWQALAHRCDLVADAPPPQPQFPPNTIPVPATPLDVKVGDWVRMHDGRNYQVRDMRAHGAGGRVLHLEGWPQPWVMPTGSRQVYRPR